MSIITQKINNRPRFTSFLVKHGIFKTAPLVVVDGGARGGFEKHWEIFDYHINLIGFELDKDECRKLNSVPGSNFKKFYPIALGRKTDYKTFHIQPHTASSSFYKSDKVFLKRFPGWKPLIPTRKIRIKTMDLDSFRKDNGIGDVDFLKLDVEGYELEIFKGAKQTLNRCMAVSAEAAFYPWRTGMPTFSEIDIYLRKMGFVLFDLPIFRWEKKTTSPLMFTDGALGPTDRGQVMWTQAIYFKDAFSELDNHKQKKYWDDLKILKLASIMELYNLEDCAIELMLKVRSMGRLKKFNTKLLIDLLTMPIDGKNLDYDQYVKYIKKQGPPRYIDGKKVSRKEYDRLKNKKPEAGF